VNGLVLGSAQVKYRFIDHTADLGLHVFGADPSELFATAARAMFDIMVSPESIHAMQSLNLQVEGADWPDLMVNWLRELLYLWTGEENILRSIAVAELTPYRISAWVDLEPFQAKQHPVLNEIKAVTYHQIQAGPESDHWEAKIIFDV